MSYVNFSFLMLLFFTNCALPTSKKETIAVRTTNFKTKVSCKIENNKLLAEFLGWTLDNQELSSYRKKEVGKFILFSPFLKHSVIQVNNNIERVTLAFNANLCRKWEDNSNFKKI